jgi:glycosyltransferase involved in cell wall biosynthesis
MTVTPSKMTLILVLQNSSAVSMFLSSAHALAAHAPLGTQLKVAINSPSSELTASQAGEFLRTCGFPEDHFVVYEVGNLEVMGVLRRVLRERDSVTTAILLSTSGVVPSPSRVMELTTALTAAEKHAVAGIDPMTASTPRPYRVVRSATGTLLMLKKVPLDVFFESTSKKIVDALDLVGYQQLINQLGYSSVVTHATSDSAADTTVADTKVVDQDFWNAADNPSGSDVFRQGLGLSPQQHPVQSVVLIDLFTLDPIMNGTSKNALNFLSVLPLPRGDGHDSVRFVVGVTKRVAAFFDLASFGLELNHGPELTGYFFDLGFALAPVTHPRQILRLNRTCLRWVVSHLDIIALRSRELLSDDIARRTIVRDSVRFADRVIAISDFSKNDLLAFFPELSRETHDRISVCLEGADAPAAGEPTPPLPKGAPAWLANEDFILLIGNAYPHKQLAPALDVLVKSGRRFVLLGGEIAANETSVGFANGALSDEQLSDLYRRANVLIYPSAYEGYGLPIAEASVRGTPVVAFDTAVSREVIEALGITSSARFFSTFSELAQVVNELTTVKAGTNSSLRGLTEYSRDVYNILLDELTQPPNWALVDARYDYFSALQTYVDSPRIQNVWATEVTSHGFVKAAIFLDRSARFITRRVTRVLRSTAR